MKNLKGKLRILSESQTKKQINRKWSQMGKGGGQFKRSKFREKRIKKVIDNNNNNNNETCPACHAWK